MSRKGRLAGVLAGRCKGSESFSRGQTSSFLPLKLHDLDHINTWKDRGGQRQVSLAREGKRESERVKHGADGKIRRKVNPDTTLPLMTGVKQCNRTAVVASE